MGGFDVRNPYELSSEVRKTLIAIASIFASKGVGTGYVPLVREYSQLNLRNDAKRTILKADLSAKALEINVR